MRENFDKQLTDIRWQAGRMGERAQEALVQALESLERGDKALAESVIKGDRVINELEHNVESGCLKVLLMQQPVAQDLMLVSGILRLVSDIERIGDQAANIAECGVALDAPFSQGHLEELLKMGYHVSKMVESALDAMSRQDAVLARDVIAADDEVDADFVNLKQMILADIAKAGEAPEEIFDVVMVAKYLERIGDHASNIAEYVEYMLTGRLKGEQVI